MAGLTSLVTDNLGLIQQGVGLISSAAKSEIDTRKAEKEQSLALRQLQQTQQLNQRQAAQDAALERERIAAEAQNAQEDRERALRRAVARQRANFAGSGISPSGGSAQAVLLGLFDETEEDLAQRERLDNLRNRASDLGLAQSNSLNVLQRTQLQERQKLNALDPYVDRAENAINFGLGALEIYSQYKQGQGA